MNKYYVEITKKLVKRVFLVKQLGHRLPCAQNLGLAKLQKFHKKIDIYMISI